MSLSPLTVSSEEQEQMLQTIEMFEVIVQASPEDCQSMEILKDAYLKLGRTSEALAIARRLADTYMQKEQFSQAMYEYEGILQRDPTNPEVIAALSELEERLRQYPGPKVADGGTSGLGASTVLQPSPGMMSGSGIALDFQDAASDGGTLIATEQTVREAGYDRPKLVAAEGAGSGQEGNEALAKFLIQHRLAPEEVVSSALERITKKNADRQPNTLPFSLIDEICRRGSIELETLLSGMIEKSKFAYIPLEYYDVDRAVVRMLPDHLTMGRLMVPFDVMSRTVMIATANPFDAAAKETAQQLLDYNIQWHLAAPQAINQVLTSVYKVGVAGPETIAFRLS